MDIYSQKSDSTLTPDPFLLYTMQTKIETRLKGLTDYPLLPQSPDNALLQSQRLLNIRIPKLLSVTHAQHLPNGHGIQILASGMTRSSEGLEFLFGGFCDSASR